MMVCGRLSAARTSPPLDAGLERGKPDVRPRPHAAAHAVRVAAGGDRAVGDALQEGVDLVLAEDVGRRRRPYWTMNSVK